MHSRSRSNTSWAAPKRNGVELAEVTTTRNGNLWHWWKDGKIERNGAVIERAARSYTHKRFYDLIVQTEGPDALPPDVPLLSRAERKAGASQDEITKSYRQRFKQINGRTTKSTW